MRILIFISFFIPAFCFAASFDCGLAKSNIEKTICENKNLSLLDEQLAEKYKQAKRVLDQSKHNKLLDSQRNWLSSLRNTCESNRSVDACITELYKNRLVVLNNYIGSNYLPSANEIDALCSYSAKLTSDDYVDLKDGNLIDINNDGYPEVAKSIIYGHELDWQYYSKDGDHINIRMNINDEYIDWYSKLIFSFKGKNYFLFSDGRSRKIVLLDRDFLGYQLCEFNSSLSKILVEKKSQVCDEIGNNKAKYLVADLASNIEAENVPGADIIPENAIKVDIDNDTAPEYLQKFLFSSTRVNPCEYRYYEVVHSHLSSKWIDHPLNKLLKAYGNNCWATVDIISFNGENYLQYDMAEIKKLVVYKVKDGAMDQYCKFEYRSNFELRNTIELL